MAQVGRTRLGVCGPAGACMPYGPFARRNPSGSSRPSAETAA
jgi:hypothetical protein